MLFFVVCRAGYRFKKVCNTVDCRVRFKNIVQATNFEAKPVSCFGVISCTKQNKISSHQHVYLGGNHTVLSLTLHLPFLEC